MPTIETRLSRRALLVSGLAGGILTTLPAQSQTGSPTMEPTIRVGSGVTTLVSIFTVEPTNQPKLLTLLQEGTELYSKIRGGWISTILLKSRDGRQLIAYTQWRDAKALDAFRQEPRMKPNFQAIDALVTRREGFICDASYSLEA